MLYDRPPDSAPLDQGDIICECPLVALERFDFDSPDTPDVGCRRKRVIVLTQTCDLVQQKVTRAVVALAIDADEVVGTGELKASTIRGAVRAGRVYGWYFLPSNDEFAIPELIVDLRQLHTPSVDLLEGLCRRGMREARVQPLFREHLAKHFADTYSRIGLPEPYATQ